jgi:predicted DNA-binding transcriptional regulator YafY
MLILQQKGNRLTVQELADKFGVSRRTIFRDFNALQEINIPVTWDKYSGYGMLPGYKVPPLMFTSKEIATIMVGLGFVKSQVDQTLVQDANSVELKIKEVLPDELQEFMSSIEMSTVIDPYRTFGIEKKKGGSWYSINSAIASKQRILFTYKSKSGEVTHRKLDPYLLVYFGDHWNLIGFSHQRGDFRNFILDQISDLEILDEKFNPKKKIDIEGLIFRSDDTSQIVEVVVEKSILTRLRQNLPANIFKEEPQKNEKVKVAFKFDNLVYINEWLLQFADKVSIHKPDELKEMREKLLRKMMP